MKTYLILDASGYQDEIEGDKLELNPNTGHTIIHIASTLGNSFSIVAIVPPTSTIKLKTSAKK